MTKNMRLCGTDPFSFSGWHPDPPGSTYYPDRAPGQWTDAMVDSPGNSSWLGRKWFASGFLIELQTCSVCTKGTMVGIPIGCITWGMEYWNGKQRSWHSGVYSPK